MPSVALTADETRQKAGGFRWTARRERAATLMAEGELTVDEIAEQCEVNRCTLYEWKANAEFRARVGELVDEIRAAIRSSGHAVIENRVASQKDRFRRMQQVIAERAKAPEMADVPGGKTGLLCRDIKSIGDGATVDVFSVDTGLLKEMRELEKHTAQELGQWTEKFETKQTAPIRIVLDVEPKPAAAEASALPAPEEQKQLPSPTGEKEKSDGKNQSQEASQQSDPQASL